MESMDDYATLVDRVKKMTAENAYLRGENNLLFQENKRLYNMIAEIDRLVSPPEPNNMIRKYFVKTETPQKQGQS
jgi:hypothetical protein